MEGMYKGQIKNRLWQARKQTGLGQKDVAFLLGHHSISQISRWERGKRIPSTIEVLKLSIIYRRLVNDLLREYYEELTEGINERFKLLKGSENNQDRR